MDLDEISLSKLPKAAFFILIASCTFGFAERCFEALNKMFMREQLRYKTDEVIIIIHVVKMLKLLVQPLGSPFVDSCNNKLIIMILSQLVEMIALIPVVGISYPKWRMYGTYAFTVFFVVDIITSMISGGAQGSFNGDQFKLPEQRTVFMKFLQLDYIVLNIAVLSGMFLGPQLKSEFACFNEQDCYILGYSLSLIFRIVALVVLLCGIAFYIIRKSERRMAPDFFECIWNGIVNYFRYRKTNPRPHWLDHAEPKYGAQLVDDIKRVFQIMVVFAVVPIYQGVHSQLNTKWFFQAGRLDGRIGKAIIIPEHAQMLNPLLSIIIIPLIMKVIDPHIFRYKMDRPFRRMIFGGLLVAFSFVLAGLLEMMIIGKDRVIIHQDSARVSVVNGFDCMCVFELQNSTYITGPKAVLKTDILLAGAVTLPIKVSGSCLSPVENVIDLAPDQATLVFIRNKNGIGVIESSPQTIQRSETGVPLVTAVGAEPSDNLFAKDSNDVQIYLMPSAVELLPGNYKLFWKNKEVLNYNILQGGVYLILLTEKSSSIITVTEPYSLHLAWIIPQNVVIVFGEIYFGIAMNEFAYLEAPMSLKAVIQALYAFSMALGELILILFIWFGGFEQHYQFFLAALVLAGDMGILLLIGLRFMSVDPDLAVI